MSLCFNSRGLLPPGDHTMTINDLKQSLLVVGPGNIPWDPVHRLWLVSNLEIMYNQLKTVKILFPGKIGNLFIDGSFVQDKAHPNDIDGYFECDLKFLASKELEDQLNLLDPHKCWTWDRSSRRPCLNSTKGQLPMWHKYRVELYPHFGQPCGIYDEFGNEQQFPAAFRKTRSTFEEKGIIKLL